MDNGTIALFFACILGLILAAYFFLMPRWISISKRTQELIEKRKRPGESNKEYFNRLVKRDG